jgi:hypothetical protein
MPIDFRTRGLRESLPVSCTDLSKVRVMFPVLFALGCIVLTEIGEDGQEAD